MPAVRQRLTSFESFANANLNQIYASADLDDALRFEINEIRSGLLVNDGQAGFEFRPLPSLAQIAPGFGAEFVFANEDSLPDLCIGQNFFTPQRETGQMAGGCGVVLTGTGNGNFESVWPQRSGFFAIGDSKSVTRISLSSAGRQDLLAAQNNDQLLSFSDQSENKNSIYVILENSNASNRNGAGSFVRVIQQNGVTQSAEVYAGSSYLSQSSAILEFCLGASSPKAIEVTWPEGKTERYDLARQSPELVWNGNTISIARKE